MSEFVEDMLDGLFCETCGVLMDGDPPGHPRKCNGCERLESKKRTRPAVEQAIENVRAQNQRHREIPNDRREAQRRRGAKGGRKPKGEA